MGRRLPAGARGRHAPDPPGDRAAGARRGAAAAVRRHHPGAPAPVAVVGSPADRRDRARGPPQPVALPRRARPGAGPDGQGRAAEPAAARVAAGDRSPLSNALRAWRTARARADADRAVHRVPRQHDRGDRRAPPAHDPGAPPRARRRADEARSLRGGDRRDRRRHRTSRPRTKVRVDRTSVRRYSSQVTDPQRRSPVERLEQRTLPASQPRITRTAPAPISGCPERSTTTAAAQAPNRLWRARKQHEYPDHDVPFHHHDLCRSFQLHAPHAAPRVRRQHRLAPLLRHQRLPQLPRGRSDHRRRDVRDLRLHPPHPLTELTSRRPGWPTRQSADAPSCRDDADPHPRSRAPRAPHGRRVGALRRRPPALPRPPRARQGLAPRRRPDELDGQAGPARFPCSSRRPSGARFTCVDGHEYVDFCLGDTGAMAGHGPGPTIAAVERQLAPRHHPHAPDRGRHLGRRGAPAPVRPAGLAVHAVGHGREPVRAPPRPPHHRPEQGRRPRPLLPRLGR